MAASPRSAIAGGVTRADGSQLGFTDHDRPLAFAGTAFEPQAGFLRRARRSRRWGWPPTGVDIEGALVSEHLVEAEIEGRRL